MCKKDIFTLFRKIFLLKKTVKFKGIVENPLFCLGGLCVVFFLLILISPLSWSESSGLAFSLSKSGAKSNRLFLGPIPQASQAPDSYLVQRNSFRALPISPWLSSPRVLASLSGENSEEGDQRTGIIEYQAEKGDSLTSVSQKFGISLETVIWANNLTKNSLVSTGKTLIILPVSGTMHQVKVGDTIDEIAKKYKGSAEKIMVFNELGSQGDIFVGDILIVPDGIFPAPVAVALKKPALVALASNYFICPISQPCRVTQRLHWYNAIDLGHGKCWEPVYAVAGGKVMKAQTTTSASKWAFGGGGNHVTILHPNGVTTYYGHLASVNVVPGQEVSQGQIIGLVGGARGMAGSGNSTGCHLHFQVTGAKNPLAP